MEGAFEPDKVVECSRLFCSPVHARRVEYQHSHNGGCCWNCGTGYDGESFMIPLSMTNADAGERVYHTYGQFCCLPCVKRYIADNSKSVTREIELALLGRMAIDVYGIEEVPCAPHRIMLSQYGGRMEIEEYRSLKPKVRTSRRMPSLKQCFITIETIETASSTKDAGDACRGNCDNGHDPRQGDGHTSTACKGWDVTGLTVSDRKCTSPKKTQATRSRRKARSAAGAGNEK